MIGKFALKVAVLVGILGLIVSRVTVLRFLDLQTANVAFALWYVVFYIWIILAYVVLFGKFDPRIFRVSLGITLLLFATGIVFYWPASGYALTAVGASPSGTPSFLLASEDELTFTFWSSLGISDNFILGLLTYVVTPVLMILAGAAVLTPQRFKNAVLALMKV